MASNTGNVALIFGASGISGWALMRECLSYPLQDTFARVIALTKRPLSKRAACVPDDPRLEIQNGLDLTNEDQVEPKLKSIEGISDVTHIYFVAYTGHGSSAEELVRVNAEIIDNALKAIDKLCPKLKFFVLQTGGKGYGTVGAGWPPAPWKEDLPRLPQPYASKIFYYAQYDVMVKHAAKSSWKWSEIRPSFLPGYVPHHNAMNIAQALGLYLSFYRSKKGAGAKCIFPGTQESWEALHTDSFQDLVAHFHIHVSLHPEKTQGRSLNIGDGESVSWERKWPVLCKYFDLEGVGPSEQIDKELSGIEWVMAQRDSWPAWIKENGLRDNVLEETKWDILDTSWRSSIQIDYDLTASREVGFYETLEPGQGYMLAFDRLRKGKFLP
ncbi:hypothetical protein GGR58DRAFT_519771 [Xylaria digitata]|nr:hypothetical protein GGR58DRAFT_519771 [Xylaria digitata]